MNDWFIFGLIPTQTDMVRIVEACMSLILVD